MIWMLKPIASSVQRIISLGNVRSCGGQNAFRANQARADVAQLLQRCQRLQRYVRRLIQCVH